jgi:apolipoprotein N-acyltransferase
MQTRTGSDVGRAFTEASRGLLRKAILAGVLHALLGASVVPGVSLWVAALVSVAPLAWLAEEIARARRAEQERPAWKARVRRGIGLAGIVWLCCLPKELVHHWWVLEITPFGLPPLLAIMSVWPAVFVVLLARVRRQLPAIPLAIGAAALWTGIEVFRGEIFAGGYRWALLAMPLVHAPWLREAGSVVGVYGVGTLAACVGGAMAWVVQVRRGRALLGVVGALVVWSGVSGIGVSQGEGPSRGSLRVTLLQTNVPPDNKTQWSLEDQVADFQRFDEILLRAALATVENPTDLIMWPETMAPGGPIHPDVTAVFRTQNVVVAVDPAKANGLGAVGMWEWAELLEKQQASLGAPMLIGDDVPIGFRVTIKDGIYDFGYDKRFNSMLLIADGQVTRERYDKMEPTPFGERMPIVDSWPWLKATLTNLAAPGMKLDLSAGTKPTTFRIPIAARRVTSVDEARVATPICFEITSPTICRRLAFAHGVRQADVLANPTNDGWFGESLMGKFMHLEHAQWRSLELGTAMVRPANTGLSGMIDAKGRVVTLGVVHPPARNGNARASDAEATLRTPGHNTDGYLTVDAPLATRTTVFARVGNGPAWGVWLVGIGLVGASLLRKRKGL